jgi:hypothetical protein
MMTVKGFAKVGVGLFNFQASQVVVYDEHGNPAAVIFQHGGQIVASVSGDEDFESYCRMLGVELRIVDLSPRGP